MSFSSSTRRFEGGLWLILGVVVAGSLWLFASSLGQTDGQAVHTLLHRPWFWRSAWLSVRFRGRMAASVLLDAVLVVPASTVGLSLMVALQYPPVLALQDALGFRLVHSVASIVLAQLVLALAFGIQAWRAAFDSLNPRFEHVARSLGSSRIRTFFTVTLPLARSGVLTGIVLAWTRALAEFGAVLLVSGTFRMRDVAQFSSLARWLGISNADVLSVGMWMEIEGGRTEQGVALAFALVLISALSVYLLHRLGDGRRSWVHP
jgi:ABC-type sulfate transport system permease component